ncbi:MAG: hypothetical protein A3J38_03265 [Gammaproteobacteria bacterium RIFCSPHIGHO2_12_FULL_45_9]|nr:MAG: hypothetical protein A3J38_03265 [Gammaproteobacteria bacterium RIFCSPHIGHO2_12_FULL_45_9]
MTINPTNAAAPPPPRALLITTIMLLAILEVLDSTIVNVALPAMMASLGANQTEITWVLTSYVVASAVILPLTGFLTLRIGRKRFLLICSIGFMISSLLCGLSTSLSEIVLFRILQGACGASLIPMSQAILRETFPLHEQGKAMAIWGLGIMAAPVLGPTLGGFITDIANWRFVFYINLPICILGIALVLAVIPSSTPKVIPLDKWGLLAMIVGIAALQILLDTGNEHDWFQSVGIFLLAGISVFAILFFLTWNYHAEHPIIHFVVFRDHNFTIACILMLCFCGTIFGLITMVPLMYENIYQYTALKAGETMAPLGLASACGMILAANVMRRVSVRMWLSAALLCCAMGAYRYTHLASVIDQSYFLLTQAYIGLGMGAFMVPFSTYALATLPRRALVEASGLFSYSRMLGTSIGISLLSTLVTRGSQWNWHHLITHITATEPAFLAWQTAQNAPALTGIVLGKLNYTVMQQANLLSFQNGFYCVTLLFLGLIPLVWLLKPIKLSQEMEGGH